MTSKTVFDFTGYRPFVIEALGGERKRTGRRVRAAAAMECQPTYLSQVLKGTADLSLEQALRLSEFLEQSPDEREMFLLMVQLERAGTPALKAHFESHVQALTGRRLLIKNRLQEKTTLAPQDHAIYYGGWQYACVHVIVTVPGLRTRDAIAAYLGLSPARVGEVLDFLESRGLIALGSDGAYGVGSLHLHLGDDSPYIQRHHSNWRVKAIQSFDRRARPDELHYSAVVTVSREDAVRVKERLMQVLQENVRTISASPGEVAFCHVMDWFEVKG